MIILLIFVVLHNNSQIFEIEDARDLEIILDDLDYLMNHPIDINTADFKELTKIPYLSVTDCLKIIEYRMREGQYNSLNDLLGIAGFNDALLDMIRPFITAKIKPLKIEKLTARFRVVTDIPKVQSAEDYYTKTECRTGHYNIYLVTERDPYENSFFDYCAAGVLIDDGKRKFVLGKYNLDVGSGLMLSPIGSFFSSIDFRVMTQERGVFPYTSVLENSGFFGAALSDSIVLQYTIFYSNQKLDGRIDSLGYAYSFDESGEHTDSLSLSRKDRINEEIFGYDARYKFCDLLVSNRTYWCSYNPPFVCGDSLTDFFGDKFWVTGIGLKYQGDLFIMFSEFCRSYKNRLGGLFGVSGYYAFIDFSIAGKYCPVGFYSPKGVEAGDDYFGGILTVDGHSNIIDYGATFTLDNNVDNDSAKYGLKLNFEKDLGIMNAKLQIRWQYTAELKNLSGSRIFLRIRPIKKIFLDVRLEDRYVYNQGALEKGIFGALEFACELKWFHLRTRYGLFNTESYASRIFVYEIDLPGMINNRMLYYKGNYGFIYLTLKPIDMLKLSCKYSVVKRESVSKRKFGCQLDFNL